MRTIEFNITDVADALVTQKGMSFEDALYQAASIAAATSQPVDSVISKLREEQARFERQQQRSAEPSRRVALRDAPPSGSRIVAMSISEVADVLVAQKGMSFEDALYKASIAMKDSAA